MAAVAGDVTVRLDSMIEKLIRKARAGGADTHAVLAKLTTSAVREVASVDHAGITVVEEGEVLRSLAATDGHALVLDNVQRRSLDGPCYESARAGRTCLLDDLRTETRWAAFAQKAAASTPVRSVIAFPVRNDHGIRAAVNFFSDTPAAFDEDTEAACAVYARHVARLLTDRRGPHAVDASKNFDVVASGKAMLMRRFGVDAAAALSVLIQLARECNESIEQAAHRVTRTPQPALMDDDAA